MPSSNYAKKETKKEVAEKQLLLINILEIFIKTFNYGSS